MSRSLAQERVGPSLAPRTVLILGLVVFAAYMLGIMLSINNYDTLAALIVGPILIAVSLPALSHQARREGDRPFFWFLLVALVLKLLGGMLQIYVAFNVYGGVSDATGYYTRGAQLAQQFRAGHFATGFTKLVGANFIREVTG